MTTIAENRSRSRFRVGEPQTAGPLTVVPVFGPRARMHYRSLRQAAAHGAFVTEVGVVNEVQIANHGALPVLLYEGELILGAAQNRVFDQPALVPARGELVVDVSCVEAGRWDVSEHGAQFTVSPDLLDPGTRSANRAGANASAAGRPDQSAVWREVSQRLSDHRIDSPSEAFTDLFDARRAELDAFADEIGLVEDQVGSVTLLNGRPVALDIVGSHRVFADLHPRLVHGYALQAIELPARRRPARARLLQRAESLLASALGSGWEWFASPGMGDTYATASDAVHGCALWSGRELVALSAFPAQVR